MILKKVNQDIAIIGMACRFPNAENYQQYWENLIQGINSVTKIPSERWNYWHEDTAEFSERKINTSMDSKWGAFITGIDQFDAGFFGISPKEVESMDPQQRILLEMAWICFEDAGYAPLSFSGKNVGVYIGSGNYDYKELQDKQINSANHYLTGVAGTMIANRLSYFLNVHGPSITTDTACSSSLVSVHQAVQALKMGECYLALAGGVNFLCDPEKHTHFTKLGMLSSRGQCYSFDANADGYVRGEGAGLILLKPLSQAIQDGDRIHGVIIGTAINHGGKSRNLTSPNPYRQAQVIAQAWKDTGVEPNKIGCVEAHGTGTPLGDPIEIIGLQKAFKILAKHHDVKLKNHYCGIGSAKSNIGHLEMAAGIAGLIKILLSFRHKKLPKLQNFTEINPHISLEKGPFYLVTETTNWTSSVDQVENDKRYAGVSSFGVGGTNAHIALSEPPQTLHSIKKIITKPYYLLTLSARHPDSLLMQTRQLHHWLEKNSHENLGKIAYTLNCGRSHLEYRCAIIISSMEELKSSIEQVINNKSANYYFISEGSIKKYSDTMDINKIVISLKDFTESEIKNYCDQLILIAESYIKGGDIDWAQLHYNESCDKVDLPFYPFLQEKYWINKKIVASKKKYGYLHPLVHKNISTIKSVCFKTTLNKDDFYLSNHIIKNQMILPGVVYLEMARIAGKIADPDNHINVIKNISWLRPLVVNQEVQDITIKIIPKNMGVDYEIYSSEEDKNTFYSQGNLSHLDFPIPQPLCSINAMEKMEHALNKSDLYHHFQEIGANYGEAFQALVWLKKTDDHTALSYYRIPEMIESSAPEYGLHPSIMDSMLQTAAILGLTDDRKNKSQLGLPKALDMIRIYSSPPETGYIYVRPINENDYTYNLQLYNESGEVCLDLLGLQFDSVCNKSQTHQDLSINESNLFNLTLGYLSQLMASDLNLTPEKIDADVEFERYGIDSIAVLMMTQTLEQDFGKLPQKLFFEYQTLNELAQYFIQNYQEILKLKFSTNEYSTKIIDKSSIKTSQSSQVSIPKNELIPATVRQQRWWKLAKQGMPLDRFNMVLRIQWSNALNKTILEASVKKLMQHQAVLRTQFVELNNSIYQKILTVPDESIIEWINCKNINSNQESFINNLCQKYNQASIPFTDYPLWRIAIMEFLDNNYEIIIISSHFIVDVYAITLLVNQLFDCYNALISSSVVDFPPLVMSFAEYAYQQKQLYKDDIYIDVKKYWQKKFKEENKKIYLDNKPIIEKNVGFESKSVNFVMPETLFMEIQNFVKLNNCTDTSYLFAIFRIILLKYTGETRLWIDIVESQRDANNMSLIGWMATTFPHIMNIDLEKSFLDVIVSVQNEFIKIKKNSLLPLSESVFPDEKRYRDEICEIQFNRIPSATRIIDSFGQLGINKISFPTIPEFYCYNLSFIISEQYDEYYCSLLYNSNQFAAELMQTISQDYQRLMRIVFSYPHQNIKFLLEKLNDKSEIILT